MRLPQGPTVQYGDLIMLMGKDRRAFIRTVTEGYRFECHFGYVDFDELVGSPFGAQVRTHLGHKMFVLVPSLDDIVTHLKREGQIIFPKDLGYIALKLGVQPGARVIEAGTGSGALTTMLAVLVGETGHVYSYERKPRMQSRAQSNLERLGLADRVTFHLADIADGFAETNAHALFLDVREPWEYLDAARAALSGAGFFGAIVPTINQVIELTEALYSGPWFNLEIEEIIRRTYKTIPARIRPDDQMIGHTGFLVFARAVERVADTEFSEGAAPSEDDNSDDADDNGDPDAA